MALIKFFDDTTEHVKPSVGIRYWKILKGYEQATPEERKKCDNISAVYLNWRSEDTPDEYMLDNKHIFDDFVRNQLMVAADGDKGSRTSQGGFTRPEPSDKRVQYLFYKLGIGR